MTTDLKRAFKCHVERFLKLRNIYIVPSTVSELIDFLYQEYEKQGRFNNHQGRFHITHKFMLQSLSQFLNCSPRDTLALFRNHPMKQNMPPYKDTPPLNKHSGSLIHLIGRKHNPSYKITQANGAPLTPLSVARAKTHFSTFDVGFSPFTQLHSKKHIARQQAESHNKDQFEQDMVSQKMALWRKKTPNKNHFFSPYSISMPSSSRITDPLALKKISASYNANAKKGTTETFEFTVTRNDIIERLDAKRPVSQKQVMGNMSAYQVLSALGVIISEKQNGRNFHWAHRQGWCLHGDQSKENLDPMTAGSNYDTLFKIEAPLKKILMDGSIDKVVVNGLVVFGQELGLPLKITYRISWETQFMEVVIDPMNPRIPTVNEHQAAESFFEMACMH